MLFHSVDREAEPVVTSERLRDTNAELVARHVGWHLPDIAADQQHGVAAVAHGRAMATMGLGGTAVDDCDEIIGDDDPVLAFLRGAFRYDALLEDFHS